MTTLGESAKLIRSKNAGPWNLTLDIMFPDEASYERAAQSAAVSPENLSTVLGVPQDKLEIYHYAPAFAIKVTIPRSIPNGHPLDTDVFGGQQFAALVDTEI